MTEEILQRTTIKSEKVSFFETTLRLNRSSKFKVIEVVKFWYDKNNNNPLNKKMEIDIRDTLTFYNNNLYDSLLLKGKIKGDMYNEQTVFNHLYIFFEYIMTECKFNELEWVLNNDLLKITKLK